MLTPLKVFRRLILEAKKALDKWQSVFLTNLPAFHLPAEPQVSIIIPVHNHIVLTVRCLCSIQAFPSAYPYEIIIVDDASRDSTSKILPRIGGIRWFRNKNNEGFLVSCNLGARQARGQYLLFLNNDTLVTPGWLDELVSTFLTVPDAGLAGSKLVFPNGLLQEAGGIVWNDGSSSNCGRGDDPEKPEYNYLREVDYCSGACLMVPKAIFETVNGFDERYKPAYYEDTDLAFKVREIGKKVLYQPLSKVIHVGGATSGRDVRKGVKRYQVLNQKKFYEKWAAVLQAQSSKREP